MIVNIIGFVLVFGLIITVHELGHFYFAKKAGILCHEFSFGMGPLIWQKKKGETKYSIRAIPIGGYVAMAGEDATSTLISKGSMIKLLFENELVSKIIIRDNKNYFPDLETYEVVDADLYSKEGAEMWVEVSRDEDIQRFLCKQDGFYVDNGIELQFSPYNRCFESKSIFARFKSIVFGPLANFILAIIVFFIAGLIIGAPSSGTTIETINDNSSAEIAGLEAGDEIVSINDIKVENFTDVSEILNDLSTNNVFEIEYLRNGETNKVTYSNQFIFNSIGFASTSNELSLYVFEGTLADDQGLVTGDVLISIDGVDMSDWSEVAKIVSENKNANQMVFKVLRDELQVEVVIVPYSDEIMNNQGVKSVGISTGITQGREFSFVYALEYSFVSFINTFVQIIDTVRLLFVSDEIGISNLTGPVGIFTMTSNAINAGLGSLINFLGMLSVNIGLVNLLPIPALDGGRLVMLAIEAITKKEANRKVENILNGVFFILLLSLMAYITIFDVLRLF